VHLFARCRPTCRNPGSSAEDFRDPTRAASRAVFYGQIDELFGEQCGTLLDDAPP
jgi:hypothetical protein